MNEDLSNRFGTTTSVVSSIFNTWIKVLAKCLQGMIHYPDKISARENLPDCFNNSYPNDVQLTVQNFSSRDQGNFHYRLLHGRTTRNTTLQRF